MKRTLPALFLLMTLPALAQVTPAPIPVSQPATQPSAQAELEKELSARLTNAVMIGSFTDGGNKAPKQDKYTIVSAKKMLGDSWLITSRIQFGDKDVTLPMIIPIRWAGDTPVIQVTDLGFPGLGTYTARVMIYKDHYAGTWSGKNHGGHMWGTIAPAPAAAGDDKPAPKDTPPVK